MAQWHNVKAGRYGSRIYVWVDGALSTEAMLAHAYPHTVANTSIVLGESKIYYRSSWDIPLHYRRKTSKVIECLLVFENEYGMLFDK